MKRKNSRKVCHVPTQICRDFVAEISLFIEWNHSGSITDGNNFTMVSILFFIQLLVSFWYFLSSLSWHMALQTYWIPHEGHTLRVYSIDDIFQESHYHRSDLPNAMPAFGNLLELNLRLGCFTSVIQSLEHLNAFENTHWHWYNII